MSTVGRVAVLPFVLVWALARLLVVPALLVAAAWWLAGPESRWFAGTALAAGLYAVFVVHVWWAGVRYGLRSLGRAPVDARRGRSRGRRRTRR